MKRWVVNGATVVGESHAIRNRGSDDSAAQIQRNGWTAIVVSDGAGSAKRSREGADLISNGFAAELLEISSRIQADGPGHWLNDAIIESVLAVRRQLIAAAGSYDLSEFHCTLVAALISDDGGFTVHVGDGAIFTGRRSLDNTVQVELHSKPENGEYANETFFITEPNWLKNIRITPLSNCEWVMLTTDGAQALLLQRTLDFSAFSELLSGLADAGDAMAKNSVIEDFLISERALRTSSDDKTLVVVSRTSTSLFATGRPEGSENTHNNPPSMPLKQPLEVSGERSRDDAHLIQCANRTTRQDREVFARRLGSFAVAGLALTICVALISSLIIKKHVSSDGPRMQLQTATGNYRSDQNLAGLNAKVLDLNDVDLLLDLALENRAGNASESNSPYNKAAGFANAPQD